MKVLGIISEYNPFHKGHLYHLEESKKRTGADFVVSVMSGNFVQRGEPAIADKWTRAHCAVDCGVDLVLELPFVFACNSAEYFAYGGLSVLEGLGCVDCISFGSESGDIEELKEIAKILVNEPEELKTLLKEKLDEGVSYAKAWGLALEEYAGEGASKIVREPNNILALEYLKRMVKTNSSIKAITIPRAGGAHNDVEPTCDYASATALRKKYHEQKTMDGFIEYMPMGSYRNLAKLEGKCNINMEDLFPMVVAEILRSSPEELSSIFSVNEGLENRLKSEIRNVRTMEELIRKVNSKRYAQTKIQRMLMHILVHLDQSSMNRIIAKRIIYGRILAMNDNGAKLLKIINKNKSAKIPIITNINKDIRDDSLLWQLLNYDVLATDLYNLTSGNNLYAGADYVVKPIKI
jgi:predicted nucleotidyltransferase